MGLPSRVAEKLQGARNAAARLLTGAPGRTHVPPVLRDLDWLPASVCVMFKVLLLTYKDLDNPKPRYLKDCCLETCKDT